MKIFILIGLFLFCAQPQALQVISDKPIDPKNLEPGCTQYNAPSFMLHNDQLFIIDGKNKYAPCDNSNMGYRIRKAMMSLGKMFGFNSRHQWGPPIIGSNPFKFVTDRIEYLTIIDETDKHCDSFTNGYFIDYTDEGDKKKHRSVTICPSAAYHSDVHLMSLMLHEARHADIKKHKPCAFGPLAMAKEAKQACDGSLEEGGAYGVSTEFYLAAARESSLTPAQRQTARSSGIQMLISRFNQLPKGLNFASVLFPLAGGAFVFDGQKEIKIISKIPADYQLMLRPENPVMVQKQTGKTISYGYAPGKIEESVDQVLIQADKSLRITFVDQADFGDMSCYLYAHKIACWNTARDKNAVWNFKDRTAKRFMILDQKLLGEKDKTGKVAFLVETGGYTTVLPATFEEMEKKGPFEVSDNNAKGIAASLRDSITFTKESGFPYQNLAISVRGLSLFYDDWNGNTGKVPNIKQLPLSRIIGPTVWSDLIEKL